MADAWGDTHFSQWAQQIRKEELDAIHNYQGFTYGVFNKALRTSKVSTLSKEQQKELKHLAGVLNKARVPENIVTYRGVDDGTALKIAQLKVGMVLKDKGFASTSVRRKVSEGNFSSANPDSVLFRVNVPQGTRGAYINAAVGKSAHYAYESEVLFAPGQFKVKITRIERRAGAATVIHGSIVP